MLRGRSRFYLKIMGQNESDFKERNGIRKWVAGMSVDLIYQLQGCHGYKCENVHLKLVGTTYRMRN